MVLMPICTQIQHGRWRARDRQVMILALEDLVVNERVGAVRPNTSRMVPIGGGYQKLIVQSRLHKIGESLAECKPAADAVRHLHIQRCDSMTLQHCA